jgi:hypothetical protein
MDELGSGTADQPAAVQAPPMEGLDLGMPPIEPAAAEELPVEELPAEANETM